MHTWNSNLEILKKRNEMLAGKIENISSSRTEVVISKSNSYTFKYDGVLINSIYNPMKESEVRVESMEKLEKANLIFCVGFGIGYEINEMLRRINKRCIIIAVVTNLDLFKKVLENVDLSNILSFDRLVLLDGTQKDLKLYFDKISGPLLYFGKNIEIFQHPVLEKVHGAKISQISKDILNIFVYKTISIGNSAGDTLDGLKHIFDNFPNILKTCDMNKLKGKFKGIPAICVASGPSINKNIDVLKKAQNRAVIFAADTILDRLRQEKIKFHATSVLERLKLMYDKLFEGNPLEEDVVLFGECVIYPKIFEEHKGNNVTLFKSTTTVERFLSDKLGELNKVPTGVSVAHMNFAIAHYLGFSPIILVGQDLAYGEDGHSHAKGTIHEKNTVGDDVRAGKVEKTISVKGIDGKIVKTTTVWKQFLDWFELEIKSNDIFCIDASEAGAYIEGSKVMTLEEAIEKYCDKEMTFDFNSYFKGVSVEEEEERLKKINEEMDYQFGQLEEIHSIIIDARKDLRKYKKNVIKKSDRLDINKFIDPINEKVNILASKNPLFMFIVQSLTTELGRKNNSLVQVSTLEDREEWYEIQSVFIKQMNGIMKLTKKIFREGMEDLENF